MGNILTNNTNAQKDDCKYVYITKDLPTMCDPVLVIIDYVDDEINVRYDDVDEPKLKIMSSDGKNTERIISGTFSIAKYISSQNYLYPSKNKENIAIVDEWMESFITTNTLYSFYNKDKEKVCEKINDVFKKLEKSLEENSWIENFDRPTCADFCWYSLLNTMNNEFPICEYENITLFMSNMQYKILNDYSEDYDDKDLKDHKEE